MTSTVKTPHWIGLKTLSLSVMVSDWRLLEVLVGLRLHILGSPLFLSQQKSDWADWSRFLHVQFDTYCRIWLEKIRWNTHGKFAS
jgi:hypothetical protein